MGHTKNGIHLDFSVTPKNSEPIESWHVSSFDLREEVSGLYECRVNLIIAEHLFSEDDLESLNRAPCSLLIDTDDERAVERKIHGIVAAVTVEDKSWRRTGGRYYKAFELVMVPALWVLTQNKTTHHERWLTVPKLFQSIVGKRLAAYDRQPPEDKTESGYATIDSFLSIGRNDYEFLCYWLEREGISFHFEHDFRGTAERIVLSDTNNGFPQSEIKLDGGNDSAAVCRIGRRFTADTAAALTKSFALPRARTVEVKGDNEAEAIFDPFENQAVGDCDNFIDHALYQHEMLVNHARVNHGRTHRAGLSAGQNVDLRTARNDFGRCLVLRSQTIGYGTAFTKAPISGGFAATGPVVPSGLHSTLTTVFDFVAWTEDLPPYRPTRRVQPQQLSGYVMGQVVGPEDVYTDGSSESGLGKVRVVYEWDRDGAESQWVPVAQGWAGGKFGTFFLPRIGMHVVILFEHGDPLRPLIVGAVHTETNLTPFPLPIDKTKSGIVTASSDPSKTEASTSQGYNALVFEDAYEQEEVLLRAQKNLNIEVLHNQTLLVGDMLPVDHDKSCDYQVHSFHKDEKGNRTVLVGAGAKKFIDQSDEDKGYAIGDAVNSLAGFSIGKHCGRANKSGDKENVDSEWKVVMGCQREEIQADRSVIVSGNATHEVLGDSHTTVGGVSYNTGAGWSVNTNINMGLVEALALLQSPFAALLPGLADAPFGGGGLNVEVKSTLVDLLIGLAVDLKFGGELAVKLGPSLSWENGKWAWSPGPETEIAELDQDPRLLAALQERMVYSKKQQSYRSDKKISLVAGAEPLRGIDELATAAKNSKEAISNATEISPGKKPKSLRKMASGFKNGLLLALQGTLPDLDAAIAKATGAVTQLLGDIPDANEKGAELTLESSTALIRVGKKTTITVEDGKVTITNSKSTVEMSDDKVKITGDVKIDGKLEVKKDTKLGAKLDIKGKVTGKDKASFG